MVAVLNEGLGLEMNVSEESHFMGALGAALFALDHIRASRSPQPHPAGPAKEGVQTS
jgi:hypothetical protein